MCPAQSVTHVSGRSLIICGFLKIPGLTAAPFYLRFTARMNAEAYVPATDEQIVVTKGRNREIRIKTTTRIGDLSDELSAFENRHMSCAAAIHTRPRSRHNRSRFLRWLGGPSGSVLTLVAEGALHPQANPLPALAHRNSRLTAMGQFWILPHGRALGNNLAGRKVGST